MVTVPILLGAYYTVIMAYSLLFIYYGFDSTLPWTNCHLQEEYTSFNCWSLEDTNICNDQLNPDGNNGSLPYYTYYNKSCLTVENFCKVYDNNTNHYTFQGQDCKSPNGTVIPINGLNFNFKSPSEDFWFVNVLGLTVSSTEKGHVVNTWSDWGSINLPLTATLAIAWLIIGGTLIKGSEAYGKLSYFLTLFPYVIITTLLAYTATFDGFMDGVNYYLTPDWTALQNPQVWCNAASQIFFNLSVGYGAPLVLSSYNSFKKNCHFDAISICFCNALTSIYAGFLVFGLLGYIQHITGVEIKNLVTAGPGLVFAVLPEGLAAMTACPQLFSFLFFFMLMLLGVTSVASSFESVVATFTDKFPQMRKWRAYILMAACLGTFALGLPICFDSGMFLFTLMDARVGTSLLYLGLAEMVVVHWCYGTSNFMRNITQDMEIKIPKILQIYWKSTWVFITPVLLVVVTIFSWTSRSPDSFMDYVFPPAIEAYGWFLEFLPVIVTAIFMAAIISRRIMADQDVSFMKFGVMLTPVTEGDESWGPRKDRGEDAPSKDNGHENETFEEEKA